MKESESLYGTSMLRLKDKKEKTKEMTHNFLFSFITCFNRAASNDDESKDEMNSEQEPLVYLFLSIIEAQYNMLI